MNSPQLTQCPKCQTSFRITPTQLRAAAGSVRCGSCLEVFDARDHMVSNEQEKVPESLEQKQALESKIESSSKSQVKEPERKSTPQISVPPKESLEEISTAINLPDNSHNDLDSLFSQIETQPIATEDAHKQKKSEVAVWAALIIAGILGLSGQYAWFNKDTLATNLNLRPAYSLVCQLFDCELPTLVDVEAIKSIQLLVRSMPEQSEGLVVDSIIINEAPFSQPWPKLELTFSNINGQVVASRIFRPSEYLGGALAGSKEIPSGKPVRLSLEIVDPGQGAVNYQLNLI